MAPNPFALLSDQGGDTSSGVSRSGQSTPSSNVDPPAPRNQNQNQNQTPRFYDKTHQYSERKRNAKNVSGNTSAYQPGPARNPSSGPTRSAKLPRRNVTSAQANNNQNYRSAQSAIQPPQPTQLGSAPPADSVPAHGPRDAQRERVSRAPGNRPNTDSGTLLRKKWPKNVSLTETLRKRDNKKHEKEVRMWYLRQKPPPSQTFIAAGTLHWPVSEFDPEEVFGKDLQALDSIRKITSCHVVYEKEKAAIQIMPTRNEQDLKDAIAQLKITANQIVARQTPLEKEHLLYWHDPKARCPSQVIHVAHPTVTIIALMAADRQVSLKTPSGDGLQAENSTRNLSQRHSARVKRIVMKKLDKLVHYEGHLQLRIRLGTFIVTRFKPAEHGNSYTLNEYKEMLNMSQFEGHVSQEASQVGIEGQMLGKLRNATTLFVPHDNDVADMSDIRPSYTATFTFSDIPGINVDLRLLMTWTPDYHSQIYRLNSQRWFTFDPQTPSLPRQLLDLNLIDISKRSAWSFNLTALHPVDETKVPQALRAFPDTVKLDTSAFVDRPNSVPISHPHAPYLRRKETRTAYQFRFDRGEFVLELSRFQITESLLKGYGGGGPATYEHRWAVNLFSPEWDAMFSENDGLPMGKKVDWSADVSKWFPPDISEDWSSNGDGWAQLLEKMQKTESLLGG